MSSMKLQALIFCSDEKILRVLRRVLSDLEIVFDHCSESDAAIHKLTRQRYEAIIVDCVNPQAASQVLRSARTAPCNKRAVTIAILDSQQKNTKNASIDLGAHFVLYQPIVSERAKTSFRAVRALMKRERRRNTRVPVEIPVVLAAKDGSQQRIVTSDLSEGGLAVRPAPPAKSAGPTTVTFTLPGSGYKIECLGEVAWTNSTQQAGIRFVDISAEASAQLKSWLDSYAPDLDKDDPPVTCKLTDLSPGGAYLETAAPFPAHTKVILSATVGANQVRVEAMVRVANPEIGMGLAFLQETPAQRDQLNKFIQTLVSSEGALPEILVQPEGLDTGDKEKLASEAPTRDPLLDLFRQKAALDSQTFLAELRKQRGPSPEASETAALSQ
jgi:DNA-binding NarL/FixJ family response regulator